MTRLPLPRNETSSAVLSRRGLLVAIKNQTVKFKGYIEFSAVGAISFGFIFLRNRTDIQKDRISQTSAWEGVEAYWRVQSLWSWQLDLFQVLNQHRSVICMFMGFTSAVF